MSPSSRCRFEIGLAFGLLVAGLAPSVHANLLANGGFESPPQSPGGFVTIGVGAEPAGFAWTVTTGNIDVGNLPNPFIDFSVPEGSQGLDLNGTVRGGVSQDFASEVGQTYRLTFVYSDNPSEGGISSADVRVSDVAGGGVLLSASVAHSTSTNGGGAVGDGDGDFMSFAGRFLATGATTRLSLTSTSASNSPSGGVLLDAVSVVPGLAADFDIDGDVDQTDYDVWAAAHGVSTRGDANGDGMSDAADYTLWRDQLGPGPTRSGVAVPEPAAGVIASAWAVLAPRSRRAERSRR